MISHPGRPALPEGPYLVVGLGRAGFAAARALSEHVDPGIVRVWDSSTDGEQAKKAGELGGRGIEVRLGGDGCDLLRSVRTIVKSPGVAPEAPVVAEAKRLGLELVDELEIGWHLVPAPVVAVTGTHGKSTTSALCVEVLAAHGLGPVLAGNTEFGPPLSGVALGEPPGSVVAEVSSYQAESLKKMAPAGAIFTNLTREHLNRYRGMADYRAAKRNLFVRGDWSVPLAALNADDELGRSLAAEIQHRGGRVLTYGHSDEADYRVTECRWDLHSAEVSIAASGSRLSLKSRLPGRHNAANLVAALALADGLGLPREPTLRALSAAPPVPGRFEAIDLGLTFDVVVDFAIAAASIASIMATAREVAAARGGRLISVQTVLGNAGPMVGEEVGRVARGLSDHLILSGSSYRGEPRLVTLAQLAAGARTVTGGELEIVIDRRKAITRALSLAREGDVVTILGRGPTVREATDWRGGFVDLDDREIVRSLL